MRRGLSRFGTIALAGGSLLALAGFALPASAQTYSCPPGYYLASDYRCYAQGYAVTPPVAPYVYYPPYAYYYPRPYYYPNFSLRFGFGGYRGYGHDDHHHGGGYHH
jgi:hypothetical protein